jgi:hypothetical protein
LVHPGEVALPIAFALAEEQLVDGEHPGACAGHGQRAIVSTP